MKNNGKLAESGVNRGVKVSGIIIRCLFEELVETGSIIEHPRNPNTHSERQIALLAEIIKATGFRNPLVVSKRSGFLIKGHGRLKAARKIGMELVPVEFQEYESEAQEWADLVADNKIAELSELDATATKGLLDDLAKIDFDLSIAGFDEGSLEQLTVKTGGGSKEKLLTISHELPGAKALKDDMLFQSSEAYGIPRLRDDMLAEVPEPIDLWCGKDASRESPFYLYNVNTDSIKGLEMSRTVLAFYTDDSRFEVAWDKPSEFTGRLINRNPVAVIAPNFSLWEWMPRAVQIYNAYRARWCARYFQEAGLKVIPDINWSDSQSYEYSFAGIPKNAPAISIQVQTSDKGNPESMFRIRSGIEAALERLSPKSCLFYCGDIGRELISKIDLRGIRSIIVDSRTVRRREVMGGKTPKWKKKKDQQQKEVTANEVSQS